KFAKENLDHKSSAYEDAFKSYLKVQSEFDEWIEFYMLEFNSALKNKKYEVNKEMIDTLINRSINSANVFINRVNSEPGLAARGVVLDMIIGTADYIKKAYDLFKEFRDAKEERQEAIMKGLEDK